MIRLSFILPLLLVVGTANAQTQAKVKPVDTSVHKMSYSFMEDTRNPHFPGDSLGQYVRNHMVFPKDSCFEKVFVSFVVETNGTLSHLQIAQGHCASLDSAALQCFKTMPPWVPGTEDGIPIRVNLRVPLNFERSK